jgi:hypothetical protein
MPSDDKPQAPVIDPQDRPANLPRGRRRRSLLARLLPVLIVVVALGGFVGLVGYYYMAESSKSAAPLIKADQQPFKIKPDNPGGMDVPDQDKQIYDRMGRVDQSSVPSPKTERLLPPPETPLPRPAAPPPANAVASAPAPVLPGSTVAPPPAAPPAAAPPVATPPAAAPPTANPNIGGPVLGASPTSRATTLASVPPGGAAPPPAPAVPPPKAAPAAPAPSAAAAAKSPAEPASAQTAAAALRPPAAGSALWRAAIGSVRSEADARKEWERQRRLYPDALTNLTPSYAPVDLGDKGVYWRIYVGPAEPGPEARDRCAALKQQKVDCFVAHP